MLDPWLEWGSEASELLDNEWVQYPGVTLDCHLLEYRKTLREWIRWRKQPENTIKHYTKAPEYINRPAPYVPILPEEDGGQNDTELKPHPFPTRARCKSMGVDFIEWKRPAGHKIPDGYCVLGNGELVLESEVDSHSGSSSLTSDSGSEEFLRWFLTEYPRTTGKHLKLSP